MAAASAPARRRSTCATSAPSACWSWSTASAGSTNRPRRASAVRRPQHDPAVDHRPHRGAGGRRVVDLRLRRDRRRRQHHHPQKHRRLRARHALRRVRRRRRRRPTAPTLGWGGSTRPRGLVHRHQLLQAGTASPRPIATSRSSRRRAPAWRMAVRRRRPAASSSRIPIPGRSTASRPTPAPAIPPTPPASPTVRPRGDDFHCFTTADRFNFAPYNLLLTPSERTASSRQGTFSSRRRSRDFTPRALQQARFDEPGGARADLPRPAVLPAVDHWLPTSASMRPIPYNPFGFT